MEKPVNLEEKALQFAPKALSLGYSLQNWGGVGSQLRADAIFSLVTRAVILWGRSIRENEFLIFWLACLEVAVSLRVMRPTSSDAKFMGGGGMLLCKPLYSAFSKALRKMLKRSGVRMPLHFLSTL